ncbi:TerD family protein [Candidatus Nitrosacidococcus tergens]|uniref:Tellurium resistance protein TerA n=1 Tax=Candidatus Nitrosacidococcus tergens TaxID=553981 RepID=A0A7G1Q9V7_9GAMM|nr:TerD family protein [Candidatus Nitrosacidococcus tergens]CAB1275915.1 Tellurium resistance protein TerA [Candidatus Nitrosacidococcus tergens]
MNNRVILTPGGNTPVESKLPLSITINYTPITGIDIDISAFALTAEGKVRGDSDMCFYNQNNILSGALQMKGSLAGKAEFSLDLHHLDSNICKVALTATIHENRAVFNQVSFLSLGINDNIEAQVPTQGMKEAALILGEFYLHKNMWKFRCVGQGFEGGLEPLAKHFGVEIADSMPPSITTKATNNTQQSNKSNLNLNKITLDKARSSISLEKPDSADYGEIRVNLNWSNETLQGQGSNKSGRFLGGIFGNQNKGIDLDVGCLFELKNGNKGVVQALGNTFGALDHPPFIKLMGDDRTGSISGGEWLYINGKKWSEIRRILIFTFIYDGVPSWKETDGVITVFVPNHPEIEVHLNDEGGDYRMCAIALLENINDTIKVTRRVDFHRRHDEMDHAYHWGLHWRAGTK